MRESNDGGHSFILDCGQIKYHLNCKTRYQMERWVEAILISMNTAREAKLSVTGAVKNISMTVSKFDYN